MTTTLIKRFNRNQRLFHFFLMVTFLVQAVTGFSRLFITTPWGRNVVMIFGGFENTRLIHRWAGALMIAGFVVHAIYLITKINWGNLWESIFGPDSLVPNMQDARHLSQRILWFFGLGSPPKLDRWTYWEKFDYWAVFWGLPLLAVTGLMLIYPVQTSRILPGWTLNVAALLHRAEAILAVTFIFVVHFFIGHLRPSSFPMNEVMFSGSVKLEHTMEEKPAWVKRLRKEGKLELSAAKPPALWFRVLYFVFGYAALAFGVYLMISGIRYSSYIRLH